MIRSIPADDLVNVMPGKFTSDKTDHVHVDVQVQVLANPITAKYTGEFVLELEFRSHLRTGVPRRNAAESRATRDLT
jgi:hypothetical protein